MKQDENSSGIWSLEMDGFTPGTYQYKFVLNGGSWIQDPNCKIVYGSANARDLVALKLSLQKLPEVKKLLNDVDDKLICDLKIKITS